MIYHLSIGSKRHVSAKPGDCFQLMSLPKARYKGDEAPLPVSIVDAPEGRAGGL